MNIQTCPFNNTEYEKVKRQMEENKPAVPDDITPDVLKQHKNNNIVLTFAKCILMIVKNIHNWERVV